MDGTAHNVSKIGGTAVKVSQQADKSKAETAKIPGAPLPTD
jgi:hypothetical protein